MERKTLERRTVLKGGAAAVGMFGSGASTAMVAGLEPAAADTAQPPLPEQILTERRAVSRDDSRQLRSRLRRESRHTVFPDELLRRRATNAADD